MKLIAYAIHDQAAKAFVTPFFMPQDGMAIRAFADNVNSQDDNNISKHPEQFTLFKVGEFDDENGKLDHFDPVVSLGNGLTFKVDSEVETLEKLINRFEKLLHAEEN